MSPHLERMAAGASWRAFDLFPANQAMATDPERLFAWTDRQGQFEQFLPRLQSLPKERDGAIAEIRAAWFLGQLGFKVIEWHPIVANRRRDCVVQWSETPAILVEVRQPSWERPLSRVEMPGLRGQRPRYGYGDARSIDPRTEVRRAAENAITQIVRDRPNLLVIVDRPFLYPTKELEPADITALLSNLKFARLGGVLCIDATWMK